MFKRIMQMKSHHQIFFAVIIAIALISLWRGVWGLMDLYLLPSNLKLSFWISMILGILILILTNYFTREKI